jgi:hypothetical protein
MKNMENGTGKSGNFPDHFHPSLRLRDSLGLADANPHDLLGLDYIKVFGHHDFFIGTSAPSRCA